MTGPVFQYTDPIELLRFPFTYGDNYTDQISGGYSNNGTAYNRSGSITVEADSYGTLILPNGTYNDVTRVRCYSTIRDSSNTAGTPSVSSFNKTEYYYYLNGNHYPIAYLYSNYVQGTTYTGGSYIDNVVVGLEEEGLNSYAIDLYPSPASSEVKIKVNGVGDIKEIILTDVAGKVVQSVDASLCIIENDTYSLDLISIANGIYFVTLRNKEGNSTTQKLVISK